LRVPLDQLGQAQGAGQAAGSGADNQNIRVQPLALDGHKDILTEPLQTFALAAAYS
jgi:hypothetical protein